MYRKVGPIAVACAAAMLATAFSSSVSAQASSTGEVIIYQIAPLESPAVSLPYMKTSAVAAVDQINANGGINGRKLVLVSCNSQFESNLEITCAQDAVNAKAAAVVGSLAIDDSQVLPILQAAHIPMVGEQAVSPVDLTNPDSFLIDMGLAADEAMIPVAAKYMHATKVALFQIDNATAPTAIAYQKALASAYHVSVVANVLAATDSTDYTEYVAKMQAAGAQAIISDMPGQEYLTLIDAMKSLGSKMKIVFTAATFDAQILQAGGSALDGDYAVSGMPSPTMADPTGAAYVSTMKKYSSETSINTIGERSWAAVLLFSQVARTITGPITGASVLSKLQHVHGMKFLWIPSLSYNQPGPDRATPRLVTNLAFPEAINNGKVSALPELSLLSS